ncbi:MAG: hypothetical protein IT289_08550 [Oligoflexia bacterium]|nr:hypothetical protein [Oligoflexia bacterium]
MTQIFVVFLALFISMAAHAASEFIECQAGSDDGEIATFMVFEEASKVTQDPRPNGPSWGIDVFEKSKTELKVEAWATVRTTGMRGKFTLEAQATQTPGVYQGKITVLPTTSRVKARVAKVYSAECTIWPSSQLEYQNR